MLAMTLTSCSAATTPSAFVGNGLESVALARSDDSELLTQDASPRVNLPATFDGDEEGWTVVAICSSASSIEASESIEVAVIPTGAFRQDAKNALQEGHYSDAVDCEGRPYR
ncbi:hypothetical protein ALI44B_12455 [Leifsonia sp. ALI-44-B]|nr:hypothetical protein ALI44B_12455 [Leifsonia sp. ALI-44-B]